MESSRKGGKCGRAGMGFGAAALSLFNIVWRVFTGMVSTNR